jgi:hypothetical protein
MKISEIRLAGWRSFGDKGVVLSGLKKINIIIGQNNSGKSNFGKYFLRLKEIAANIVEPKNFKDCYNLYNSVSYPTQVSDTWAWKKLDIECTILLRDNLLAWKPGRIPDFLSHENPISLHACHSVSTKVSNYSTIVSKTNLLNIPGGRPDQVYDKNTGTYVDFRQGLVGGYDNYFYWKRLLDSLIFIDPIRHFDRSSAVKMDFYFDGAAIIKELALVQSNDRPAWTDFCTSMTKWLGDIISDTVQQITIVNDEFRIDLSRGGQRITANLSELGTGVAQIVMLLAHLYLNKEKEFNVFIDEPESNLHPNSVIRLVKIFEYDLPNHSFFITTHSSVLIDQISQNWSVHRVSRQLDQSSEVSSCALPIHKFQLLDDLGIRASQILQSNIIIWVEGPSDAIYLKKWISDISNNELEAGEHYSFLFYGGSNLRSHTLLDDANTDAIDLMCTSRYAAIFCDTDFSSQAISNSITNLKPRVTAIINRLLEVSAKNVGINGDLNDFVKIWLTAGRETENYVPEELFFDILSQSPFRKFEVIEKIGGVSERIMLEVDSSLRGGLSFGEFDSFDECFAKMYKRADGNAMTSTQYSNIAQKYSSSKVGIAKAVVASWEKKFYSKILQQEVSELVEMIKIANGAGH